MSWENVLKNLEIDPDPTPDDYTGEFPVDYGHMINEIQETIDEFVRVWNDKDNNFNKVMQRYEKDIDKNPSSAKWWRQTLDAIKRITVEIANPKEW